MFLLPAAKPSCPKTVRVVVVVVVGGGGSSLVPLLFEYLCFESSYPRDLSPHRGGSIEINQDLLLRDQISLWGGVCHSLTRFLFGMGSFPFVFVRVKSLTIDRGLLI